jgi:hypothetical protein
MKFLQARKLISDAITALPPANVHLLMQMPLIYSVSTKTEIYGYITPNTTVGKTGYKWKMTDT